MRLTCVRWVEGEREKFRQQHLLGSPRFLDTHRSFFESTICLWLWFLTFNALAARDLSLPRAGPGFWDVCMDGSHGRCWRKSYSYFSIDLSYQCSLSWRIMGSSTWSQILKSSRFILMQQLNARPPLV